MNPLATFQVTDLVHPLEELRHISPLLIVSSLCSTVVTVWLTHVLVNAPDNPHKWLTVLIAKTPRRAFKVSYERLERLPEGVKFSSSLSRKTCYDRKMKLLVLKGVMTRVERDELLNLSQDAPYRKAVEGLFRYSLEGLLNGLIPCEKILEGLAFRVTWIAVTGVLWASLILALVSLYWIPLAMVSYWLLLGCIVSLLVLMLILICASLKANRILEGLSLDTVEKVLHVQSFYNKALNKTAKELVAEGLLKGR
ncbi:MAG: hypothetical protein Q6359_07470 [Candidatus Brocadiales bacterium]|nr:hypothetical protein [Candidatus Brocadiales bacterium]